MAKEGLKNAVFMMASCLSLVQGFWNLAVYLNHPGKYENNSLWGPDPRNSDKEVQVWAWDVCWQQRFLWDGAAAGPEGGRHEVAEAQEKMNYTVMPCSLHPEIRVGVKSLPAFLPPHLPLCILGMHAPQSWKHGVPPARLDPQFYAPPPPLPPPFRR